MTNADMFSYPPRLMRRAEAARYVGMGVTTFDELIAEGKMPKPKKIRTMAVWDRVDLDGFVNDLTLDGNAVREQFLAQYRKTPEQKAASEQWAKDKEAKLWADARALLLRDSGVAWGTLANLIGRERYSPELIMEKTGLNIERTGGAWFGTPK
jgi:predicted DNA-binding transcriptional regulator AlpA